MAKAKEIEGLDCGARASAGVRLVLATRLEEMFEYRAAALDWTSDDGVHDMRVASRRLRSVVRDFRPHMRGGKRFEAAREELKRLAGTLGEVRDEDVAIHALEKLRADAPDEARAGLELFALDRRARREGARVELTRAFEEASFEESRRRIAEAFERATVPRNPRREDEVESFRELGRRIILRSWEELSERAPDLFRPNASRRLHKLRIAAKRLRYALELFAACFGEAAHELAKELAELQGALGKLHDCDDWIEESGEFLSGRGEARERVAGEEEASERRAAAFWLLEHFAGKRTESYREALAVWSGMERDGFASRLTECLDAEEVEEMMNAE